MVVVFLKVAVPVTVPSAPPTGPPVAVTSTQVYPVLTIVAGYVRPPTVSRKVLILVEIIVECAVDQNAYLVVSYEVMSVSADVRTVSPGARGTGGGIVAGASMGPATVQNTSAVVDQGLAPGAVRWETAVPVTGAPLP